MKQYMTIDQGTGRIDALFKREDDDPAPELAGFTTILIDPPLETLVFPEWVSDERWWCWDGTNFISRDLRALTESANKAISRIDALADSVRLLAIGNDTREIEYRQAEIQARPYADSGYVGPTPEMVDSWASAKRHRNGGVPWSGQQAADDIIATANLWAGALAQIRRLRLDAKEEIRALVENLGSVSDIDLVEAVYEDNMRTLMATLTA